MEMIWNRSSIVYFQLNESHIPASCRICRLPVWPLYLRQEALSTKYQTIFSTQCVILGRTFSSKSAKNSHSCLGRSFVRVSTRKRPPSPRKHTAAIASVLAYVRVRSHWAHSDIVCRKRWQHFFSIATNSSSVWTGLYTRIIFKHQLTIQYRRSLRPLQITGSVINKIHGGQKFYSHVTFFTNNVVPATHRCLGIQALQVVTLCDQKSGENVQYIQLWCSSKIKAKDRIF